MTQQPLMENETSTKAAPGGPAVSGSGGSAAVVRRRLRTLLQSPAATIGALVLLLCVLTALLAPFISPYPPGQQHPQDRLLPPFWLEGGSTEFLLGTDNLGRDILSRIVHGVQVTLLVSGIAVIISAVLGVTLGVISGFYAGGWFDTIIQRLVDANMAIPNILLILVIIGSMGPSTVTLTVVLGVTGWVIFARMVRADVVSLRERDFVRAARSIGTRDPVMMMRHILPNVMPTTIVVATLSFGTNIVIEASLSFLGLGIQPPTVTWGYVLNEGRDYLATAWWIATFPGLAITITVLAIMFLGDWLRDVLDPREKKRS
ncbi:ABC transporter permease [Nesterenkonia ebinurensis]|uniref:ABC transporter permease n=1 Tax=Nesterenkonia ebinurensis TaxID=2608252 RepID=UPI001CC72819|nr:ABC transporter permease [Nesterenkonia ebinurensis]